MCLLEVGCHFNLSHIMKEHFRLLREPFFVWVSWPCDWIFLAFHKMATLTHLAAFYSALVSQAAEAWRTQWVYVAIPPAGRPGRKSIWLFFPCVLFTSGCQYLPSYSNSITVTKHCFSCEIYVYRRMWPLESLEYLGN